MTKAEHHLTREEGAQQPLLNMLLQDFLLVSRLWDALGMCWHPLFAMLRRQTFRFAQIFVTRSLLNNKQASRIAHNGAMSEKIECSS